MHDGIGSHKTKISSEYKTNLNSKNTSLLKEQNDEQDIGPLHTL